jgi:hypothetical protein
VQAINSVGRQPQPVLVVEHRLRFRA